MKPENQEAENYRREKKRLLQALRKRDKLLAVGFAAFLKKAEFLPGGLKTKSAYSKRPALEVGIPQLPRGSEFEVLCTCWRPIRVRNSQDMLAETEREE